MEVPVSNGTSAEELKKLEDLHRKKGGAQNVTAEPTNSTKVKLHEEPVNATKVAVKILEAPANATKVGVKIEKQQKNDAMHAEVKKLMDQLEEASKVTITRTETSKKSNKISVEPSNTIKTASKISEAPKIKTTSLVHETPANATKVAV